MALDQRAYRRSLSQSVGSVKKDQLILQKLCMGVSVSLYFLVGIPISFYNI